MKGSPLFLFNHKATKDTKIPRSFTTNFNKELQVLSHFVFLIYWGGILKNLLCACLTTQVKITNTEYESFLFHIA